LFNPKFLSRALIAAKEKNHTFFALILALWRGIDFTPQQKGETPVKKLVSVIVVFAFCLTTATVFAGGDKNRGTKGKGEVVRTQVTGKGR
jgi:hypothetical protein